jgi:hypothetical protein
MLNCHSEPLFDGSVDWFPEHRRHCIIFTDSVGPGHGVDPTPVKNPTEGVAT